MVGNLISVYIMWSPPCLPPSPTLCFPRIRPKFRVTYRVLRHGKGWRGGQHPPWRPWGTLVSALPPVINYPCRLLLQPSSFTTSDPSDSPTLVSRPSLLGAEVQFIGVVTKSRMQSSLRLFGACLPNTASASQPWKPELLETCSLSSDWGLRPGLGYLNLPTASWVSTIPSPARCLVKEKQVTWSLLRNQPCLSSLHLLFELFLPHPR